MLNEKKQCLITGGKEWYEEDGPFPSPQEYRYEMQKFLQARAITAYAAVLQTRGVLLAPKNGRRFIIPCFEPEYGIDMDLGPEEAALECPDGQDLIFYYLAGIAKLAAAASGRSVLTISVEKRD